MSKVLHRPSPAPLLVIAALITVQVLFGINYVVTKIVVDSFPPLLWASLRIIVSAVIMLAIAGISRRQHPIGGAQYFLPLLGLTLLGIVINQSSFLVGLHYTTATNSAILNTLIPLFTLLLVTLRGQEPLTWRRGLGFVVAFTGVLVLRRIEEFSLSDKTLVGDLLTVLNCLSYACFLSFGKKFLEKHDRIWTTAWLFSCGSVGLTALSLPYWQDFQWPELGSFLLGCMAFAVLGGTLATYFLNFWALAYTRSSSVALFIYIQPVVTSALAWAWFGQRIPLRTLLSSLMIFSGVLMALSQKREPPSPGKSST